MQQRELTVATAQEGVRLDKALEALLPETGLRYRRRLIDEGLVTVNDRPAKPSLKLIAGMRIRVAPAEDTLPSSQSLGLYVIDVQDGLAALFKPQGLHSASISGRGNVSVEAFLPLLFPDHDAVLLNRLDLPTSGIVMAALGPDAMREYLAAEDAGEIVKEYASVVAGHLEEPATVRLALDAADRKTTHVVNEETPDDTRWTEVAPLSWDQAAGRTRVRCRIKKGARHQIRAHLATLGHPLVGDLRYGGPEADRLYLHHERLCIAGRCFTAPCPF